MTYTNFPITNIDPTRAQIFYIEKEIKFILKVNESFYLLIGVSFKNHYKYKKLEYKLGSPNTKYKKVKI